MNIRAPFKINIRHQLKYKNFENIELYYIPHNNESNRLSVIKCMRTEGNSINILIEMSFKNIR